MCAHVYVQTHTLHFEIQKENLSLLLNFMKFRLQVPESTPVHLGVCTCALR